MTVEESRLINRAQSGDMMAFEKLIYRYDKNVLAIAYSFRNNKEDAKDIYQEVFIRVFKGLKNFERKSEFSTWLYRIATNVCLSFRSRQKKLAYTTIDIENNDEADSTFDEKIAGDELTDSQLLNNELSENIQNALNGLSTQQKMIFTLKHYQDFKIKEIAAMLNCAEGTVKKTLFVATQRMKEKLQHLVE